MPLLYPAYFTLRPSLPARLLSARPALIALLVGAGLLLSACEEPSEVSRKRARSDEQQSSGSDGDGGTGSGSGSSGADSAPPVVVEGANSDIPISETTVIRLVFSESIDTDSLVLDGDLAADIAQAMWEETDEPFDTLVLAPETVFTTGNQRSLLVTVEDLNGNEGEYKARYRIAEGLIYVNPSGSDSNDGSIDNPVATISEGLNKAVSAAYNPVVLMVAEGDYFTNYNNSTDLITLSVGQSLFGGFSDSDWSRWDPHAYVVNITDLSNAGGGGPGNPNRVINVTASATDAIIIRGFRLWGGSGTYSAGIHVGAGGATIQENFINAGIASSGTIGVNLENSSYTRIVGNKISGGSTGGNAEGIRAANGSQVDIFNNVISGGSGNDSNGIHLSAADGIIRNNTVSGGEGAAFGRAIYLNTAIPAVLINNILFSIPSGGVAYCIEEVAGGEPDTVSNNDFYSCTHGLYYEEANTYATLATMEAYFTSETISSGGNIEDDPAFSDETGGDTDRLTLEDNDWSLTSGSPTSVTEGGIDLSDDFRLDIDGVLRSDPWSIGAYEFD